MDQHELPPCNPSWIKTANPWSMANPFRIKLNHFESFWSMLTIVCRIMTYLWISIWLIHDDPPVRSMLIQCITQDKQVTAVCSIEYVYVVLHYVVCHHLIHDDPPVWSMVICVWPMLTILSCIMTPNDSKWLSDLLIHDDPPFRSMLIYVWSMMTIMPRIMDQND